jgi:hypothetical protein
LFSFPGRQDDQVDALTQGLAWGRLGQFLYDRSQAIGRALGKQKQRPAHDDALRGLAGTMASPQIMWIRAKADIVEKPKPEPSH